jgi:iron(III) transport system permease protein
LVAIFVMSAVLCPYAYITARASFVAQSVCVLEVSRTLGRTASQTFWKSLCRSPGQRLEGF